MLITDFDSFNITKTTY